MFADLSGIIAKNSEDGESSSSTTPGSADPSAETVKASKLRMRQLSAKVFAKMAEIDGDRALHYLKSWEDWYATTRGVSSLTRLADIKSLDEYIQLRIVVLGPQ
jgi:hypothetical protein